MIKTWILAARPKTLTAGIVPVLVGSAFAFQHGKYIWGVLVLALFCSLCIQIGTNFVNDASDFEKGADTEERLGPPRMAAMGLLSPRALYIGSAICFMLAFLGGLYLVAIGGWIILTIGLFSILFAIAYTKGPFPLAYLGLGDIFVFLFFGIISVLGTIYCHGADLDLHAIVLASIVGLLGVSLIAVNNLRDIPTDVKVGKKTLAVWMGDRGSRIYYSLLILGVFVLWLAETRLNPFFWLPLLTLPLALRNIQQVNAIQERRLFNRLLGASAGLQISFGLLAAISLVMGK